MRKKILLVDDDKDILEFLSYNFKKEGFKVFTENNGFSAIQTAQDIKPDLIVLDVMMPGIDGLETCKRLREIEKSENVLIVFLTARAEDYSQLSGLDAGADAYITKPVSPAVFVGKIKALLNRIDKLNVENKAKGKVIKYKNITIDKNNYRVEFNGEEILLAKKEFKLLYLLASTPGKIFTRDEIYSSVWGESVVVGDRTIDVHIRKLRQKLGENFISTVKGVGYRVE